MTTETQSDPAELVTLSIYEECRYTVTGASVYEAMRAFLDNPSAYLSAVEERSVLRRDNIAHGAASLTDEETAEVERAEYGS